MVGKTRVIQTRLENEKGFYEVITIPWYQKQPKRGAKTYVLNGVKVNLNWGK